MAISDIYESTRCADSSCWQRDTCERYLDPWATPPDTPTVVQVAGSLRARWQDHSSVCLHYIEKGAVS